MKHNRILAASLLLALCGVNAEAGKQISSFREITIGHGESVEIGGVMQSDPDIYHIEKADGTWEAVRLTVTPESQRIPVTQPYLNNNTPNSISVNWKTDKKADGSTVSYGLSPDRLDSTCTPTYRSQGRSYFWYTATLTGLKPDTPYYYKVSSNGHESEIYRFRTMPENGGNGKTRVLFIGDHQRNEHSDYEWLLNAAKRKVAEKYGDAPLEDNINFLMNDGDQVDGGNIYLYEDVHLYKSRFVSPFIANMTAVGNHEYKNDPDLNFYNLHYHDYGDIEYRGIKSGDCGYYAYQAGDVLFVILNSDDTSAAQKLWVRKVIAAASVDAGVDFIVSVQHRPLYAEQWTYDVSSWMLNEIMPILSSTPKHVLNCAGHHHLYARGQMTDTPVYHIISGGGVGTSAEGYEQLWGITPDNRNLEEVQKTIDHWTYQLLELDSETKEMTVETYSIGNSRLALDNELVDRFSRKIYPSEMPATPEIAPADGDVTLPFEFSQTGETAHLHSVQYQVSDSESFESPLISRLLTAEDFYGADGNFMPLDLNKGLDLKKFTVGEGALANGTYYLRARNRNSNLDWSDYSTPVQFTVTGSAERGSVTVSQRFIRTGSQMSVSYAGSPVGTDAWIGIYHEGHTPGTAGLSADFSYTSAETGTCNFNAPAPGVYFAVLFKDGGYTEISPRVYFVVSDYCDDDNTPSIETDKYVYNVGDPIVVSHHNAPCISKDWIGLYSEGTIPVSGKSHSYLYVGSDPEGSLTLNIAGNINYTTPVTDGIYYVGYFNADAYHESADRAYLVVGKPVIVDTGKTTYLPTETVTLVYDGAPMHDGNRIMVYGGTDPVAEIPVSATNGSLSFGPLAAGDYEVCMATGDGDEISPRKAIKVAETDGLTQAVAVDPVTVNVSGSTVGVTCADGIDTVSIIALDAKVVASYQVAGATSFSATPNIAPGIYFIKVDNVVRKVILK